MLWLFLLQSNISYDINNILINGKYKGGDILETIMEVINTFEIQAILRILLGFLLAGFIGAEREWLNKPAGFKTHSLIGVSAVLVMLCGEYISRATGADASRIPAQLLSGIGFIGAGTILHDGFNVKGLTTAASLLVVTCMGLCIGAGFYIPAIIAAAITYIILEYSYKLHGRMDHFSNVTYLVKMRNYKETIETIEKLLDENNISIRNIKNKNNKKDEDEEEGSKKEIEISVKLHKNISENKIIRAISSLDDVIEVEEL